MSKAIEERGFQPRFYRDWMKTKGQHSGRVAVCETDLQIITDLPFDYDDCRAAVESFRSDIITYIRKDNRFLTSLEPVKVSSSAAPLVKRMASAGRRAGVGPMASVAGAIAEAVGRRLLDKGCREAVVENGGDVFLAGKAAKRVGIFAGKGLPCWRDLAINVAPREMPLGICTSSGAFGHSFSFGRADSVVIFSPDAALADAAATAVCNRVSSAEDMRGALSFGRSIPGVSGIIIIVGDKLASWGKVEFISR
jgi:ApbE superfamily uncharacterized protein (UPF0280 family)